MKLDWKKASCDKWTILIRLTLGITIFLHGAQKALAWGNTVAYLSAKQGIPELIGHLVVIGELVGGLALILGFLTRIAAASNALIMAGAVLIVHLKGGFFAAKGGFEYPLVLMMLAIFLTIKGAGPWSLDAKLFGKNE